MKWWEENARFRDGNLVPVGLIQFDLSGHSAWASTGEERGLRYEIYQGRVQLQNELRRSVAGYGFEMHHWAGDGGLFAGLVENSEQADSAYRAMSQMFEAFKSWCRQSTLREQLRCRISGTVISDLCIDHEPGNWYSPHLNLFLKYERQIGLEGTIRITRLMKTMLHHYSHLFDVPRLVALPDGTQVPVFQDNSHVPQHVESGRTFREWINRHRSSIKVPQPTVPLAGLPENTVQFGNSVILNSSLAETGYSEIYLESLVSAQVRGTLFLSESDRRDWQDRRKELVGAGVIGTKCRVHTLKPELLDDPAVRLEWSQGSYADANAFAGFISDDPTASQRYSEKALKVLQEGTEIPNTLSNHSLVVIGSGTRRELLLAHRRKGTRQGSYSRNCWSVSFEEQFNPVKELIANRSFEVDNTIEGSILRGLREEFLTSSYSDPIQVAIHAFQLEAYCLNFGFLAVVSLPVSSFEEVLELWPGAPDSMEHDALAALPFSAELIAECLASERLPGRLFDSMKRSVGFSALGEEDHGWHPTSPVRLVLALWQAQEL